MPDNLSIFNPKVGISGISTPRSEDISINRHKGGVSPALSVSGNEPGLEAYDGHNMDSIVEQYLRPKSRNPDLMAPHVFQKTVSGALGKLGDMGEDNPLKVMTDELNENNNIIRMFTSLVIPG